MSFKNSTLIVLIGMVIGISNLFLNCGNDPHGNRDGGMMRDGHMGHGRMMGNGQGMKIDTSGTGQQGMMGNEQVQPGKEKMQQSLTLEQARQRAEEYLQNTGNTTLKIGPGKAKGNEYEFPLERKSDDTPIARILVDKSTGKIRSQK